MEENDHDDDDNDHDDDEDNEDDDADKQLGSNKKLGGFLYPKDISHHFPTISIYFWCIPCFYPTTPTICRIFGIPAFRSRKR